MATPESKTKRIIANTLKARGAFYFMPQGTGFAVSGASDYVGSYRGMFFSIEAKAHPNKPTALQLAFMIKVQQSEAFAIWVDETNAKELVDEMLNEMDALCDLWKGERNERQVAG